MQQAYTFQELQRISKKFQLQRELNSHLWDVGNYLYAATESPEKILVLWYLEANSKKNPLSFKQIEDFSRNEFNSSNLSYALIDLVNEGIVTAYSSANDFGIENIFTDPFYFELTEIGKTMAKTTKSISETVNKESKVELKTKVRRVLAKYQMTI